MDALAPDLTDRRPSIRRLAGVLRSAGLGQAAGALCLPLCLLFARHLRFDAADPHWADRDRLVFAPSLSPLADRLADLVGTDAGSFDAQGSALGVGSGMAMAERLLAGRYGRSLVDHRCWAVAPGADLATGAVQEAAWLAGAWRLGRLTAITEVAAEDAPGLSGFAAAGWSVRKVAAGDAGAVAGALSAALRSQKPTLIACVRDDAAIDPAGETLMEEGRLTWLATGRRNAGIRRTWLKRLARHAGRLDFDATMAGRLPAGWHAALATTSPFPAAAAACSTADTLRTALARLSGALPDLAALPGDASWTCCGARAEFAAVREVAGQLVQGVACAMVGASLHGGLLPVAAHGLADAEKVQPGLRAAAGAGLRLVHILVEPAFPCPAAGQRASLRAMRNLHVFRPADASEALECTELALRRAGGPSVLLLSDVPVPILGGTANADTLRQGRLRGGGSSGAARGHADRERPGTACCHGGPPPAGGVGGSCRGGVPALLGIFGVQDAGWQDAVLGDAPRFGLECGSGFGWDRWLGAAGLFIGPERSPDRCADGAALPITARRTADIVLRQLGLGPANHREAPVLAEGPGRRESL